MRAILVNNSHSGCRGIITTVSASARKALKPCQGQARPLFFVNFRRKAKSNLPLFFVNFRCNHDVRNKLGTRLEKLDKIPFKGLLKKMGNKLSCSCGPLKIKAYRYDATKEPWGQMMQNATTDERHIIR